MLIREAIVEDAEKIIEYLKVVFDESDFLSRSSSDFNISLESEKIFLENMANSANSTMLVVFDKDEIVASCSVHGNTLRRQNHSADFGISVLKKYYNMGIGSKLLEEAINFCKEANIKILSLEVDATNARAIHLYKKFGFILEGNKRNQIYVNDEYHDLLIMALDIGGIFNV